LKLLLIVYNNVYCINILFFKKKKKKLKKAYAISRIAQHDWPESWPHLFDSLLENLRSGDSKQVHGAMHVLSEFIRNDITDQQFPIVAPVLFPELFKIFNEEKVE